MRTAVLNYIHTFHPEAQAEFDRLAAEEKRLTLALARRGEVDDGEPKPKRRMSQKAEDFEGELEDVREQMDAQRKIIASGVVRLLVKGLTRGEFRRLLVQHPAREGDSLDQKVGYNGDTFGDALIQACIVKTLAHELDGGGAVENRWDEWADQMTNGQWEEIFTACMKLTNDPSPALPR